jgi:hypothetical protein
MSNSPTIPLNHQYLLEALHAATQTNQELVQRATSQLKAWEKEPGYWVLLQVRSSCGGFVRVLQNSAVITMTTGWEDESPDADAKCNYRMPSVIASYRSS